ncbi:MAG: hypothetical protein QXV17_12335 [Candidatus Micrarchaeaceae archaeon]
MKFVQFPYTQINYTSNGGAGILYQNTSLSYVLIVGLMRFFNYPGNTDTSPYFFAYSYIVQDFQGNQIDLLEQYVYQLASYSGSITVWNGTSMETEPATFPTTAIIAFKSRHSLLPPRTQLVMYIGASFSGSVKTSGWGFLLSDSELNQILNQKDDENEYTISKSIMRGKK